MKQLHIVRTQHPHNYSLRLLVHPQLQQQHQYPFQKETEKQLPIVKTQHPHNYFVRLLAQTVD